LPVALAGSLDAGIQLGGQLLPARTPSGGRLLVPGAPMPLAEGRLLGRLLVQVEGIPAQAKAASIVLVDAKGDVRDRMGLSLPAPRNFAWEPSASGLTAGRYGLALEVLLADAEGLSGWRTVPVALDVASSGLGFLPAGDPDKVVRATLFDASGTPTESMLEWLQKTAASLRGEVDRLAVVSVHDHGAGDGQKRSDRQAAAVRKTLIDNGMRGDRLLVLAAGGALADYQPAKANLGDHRVEVRQRGLLLAGDPTSAKLVPPQGVWVDGQRQPEPLPGKLSLPAGQPVWVVAQKADGSAAVWQRSFGAKPPGGPAPTPAAPAPENQSDVMAFGAELLDALSAADDPRGLPASPSPTTAPDASAVAAADLQLYLPRAGLELASPELALRGRTRPGNRLTVQGRDLPVAPDGSFYALVTLPLGASTLTVTATDPAGHRATFERPVRVRAKALFLMAIADTSVSHVGAHLQEVGQPGSLQLGQVQLYGRAAVYLKGRLPGVHLGLKDLRYTAHLDTARDPQLQDFASSLIDPTRFYPVYGDASDPQLGAPARGKLYVLIEADDTKLLVGNARIGLHGIELLRYDRSLYGAQVELRRLFGKDLDTRVQLFAAGQEKTVRRRTDLLRGTGGSLYYLAGRDVIEGSERIELVVRDRQSNLELARLPQSRNVDYTLDAREGRILFKSPVSGAVDATFGMGQNGLAGQHLHWNGHPVFVEAIYEARTAETTDDVSFGGRIEERVFAGKVRVGATYVQEGRSANGTTPAEPTYRVAGADASFQIAPGTKLGAEYAWSQARDSLVSVSDDGGLSFATPNRELVRDGAGKPVEGQAVSVQFESEFADFLPAAKVARAGAKLDAASRSLGRIRARWQWVSAGFQSGGTQTEEDQQKLSVDSQFPLGQRNVLQVRYDMTRTDRDPAAYGGQGLEPLWGVGNSATSGSFSAHHRHVAAILDTHRLGGGWRVFGGTTYGYGLDANGGGHHSQTVSGGASWQASPRLTLRADQEVVLLGDPSQFRTDTALGSAGDHFITTLGLDYKIGKTLAVTLQERLGWGGQNATVAGLRTQLDASSSAYLQQRFEDTSERGRLASATVVGAESRYGDDQLGRAFGEYQIDALNPGRMNRAILGVGKRFALGRGLTLDAGYERQQVFGGGTGEQARDVLSLGGEWLRSDEFKLTSRQEVRLDEGGVAGQEVRKLQLVSLTNGQAALNRAVVLFGRAHYLRTQDQFRDVVEAESLEATLAAAYRPVTHNWLQVIGKYSHLIEQRPQSDNTGVQERAIKDIFGLETVAELPWRLQVGQKLAWRRSTEVLGAGLQPAAPGEPGSFIGTQLGGLGAAVTSDTFLTATRLGWHASPLLDLAGEYRFLTTALTGDLVHGALVEAAWTFAKAVRLGVGYNFSHIETTEAGDMRKTDDGGFFLRMIGMY